jgi:hypothetical protein
VIQGDSGVRAKRMTNVSHFQIPTHAPTPWPTASPTAPTGMPTSTPTQAPTDAPTGLPTSVPTEVRQGAEGHSQSYARSASAGISGCGAFLIAFVRGSDSEIGAESVVDRPYAGANGGSDHPADKPSHWSAHGGKRPSVCLPSPLKSFLAKSITRKFSKSDGKECTLGLRRTVTSTRDKHLLLPQIPTRSPTGLPTASPTAPTGMPTSTPTQAPTDAPTGLPTSVPTEVRPRPEDVHRSIRELPSI